MPQDESQSRVKEERKDEEVTPKSEPAAANVKEEVGDQDSDDLREELQRNLDAFPPDSEDSDPFMFHTTIFLEHDREAVANADPIDQLREQVYTMEHNIQTLRTRVTQIADLRDAQGLREGQRALTARLAEMEECTSVQTLREFMNRIMRLESLVGGDHGGVIGEAIRACNRRLDNHKATMDDFYARIRIQDWYHDLSEQDEEEEMQQTIARLEGHDTNAENQPGMENRPLGRRRIRSHAPQCRVLEIFFFTESSFCR